MDFTANTSHERLLLVDQQPENLVEILGNLLQEFDVSLYTEKSAIEGILKYKELSPGLMLINSNLPDMFGMSLATLIKDEENGVNTSICLYNITEILQNTKADFFILKLPEEKFQEVLLTQIQSFYDLRFMQNMHSTELLRAKQQQYEFLPVPLETEDYSVTSFFSAYGELSGDSYTYWKGRDGALYGVLFDCTGHDFVSYTYVNAARIMLKKDMRLYELGATDTLAEVLKSVNDDLFAVDVVPEMTTAIVFKLDPEKKMFRYCTAGMPGILVRDKGTEKWRTIPSENFILGCEENVKFDEQELPLESIANIIVCSDGFFELTFHQKEVREGQIAKHDDVSAIFISVHLQKDAGISK